MSPEQRFWKRVDKTDGCWLFGRGVGYGQFMVAGRRTYAHRWAYEFEVGPIPEGSEVDHLCKTQACVNPAHLEAVTHRENIRRAFASTHCKRGHEFNAENTLYPNGAGGVRRCRACAKAYMKVWKARQKVA